MFGSLLDISAPTTTLSSYLVVDQKIMVKQVAEITALKSITLQALLVVSSDHRMNVLLQTDLSFPPISIH